MAVFRRNKALFVWLNASTSSCWILSEIGIYELGDHSFSLSLNNYSSFYSFVLFKESVSKFYISVVFACRQKEPSFIKLIVRAIYRVNDNLLNDICVWGRSFSNCVDFLSVNLGPVEDCNRRSYLELYFHNLPFWIANNIFEIDILHWNMCIWSVIVIV